MPSKKKKYNSRFPPARIKKIMQTDDDIGKVAAAVPVLISKCLEMFLASILTHTGEVTKAKRAKTMSTSHLKECIMNVSMFDFLKDVVANVPEMQNEDEPSTSSITLVGSNEETKKPLKKRSAPLTKQPKKRMKLSKSQQSETEDHENVESGDASDDGDDDNNLHPMSTSQSRLATDSNPATMAENPGSSFHIPLDRLTSPDHDPVPLLQIMSPNSEASGLQSPNIRHAVDIESANEDVLQSHNGMSPQNAMDLSVNSSSRNSNFPSAPVHDSAITKTNTSETVHVLQTTKAYTDISTETGKDNIAAFTQRRGTGLPPVMPTPMNMSHLYSPISMMPPVPGIAPPAPGVGNQTKDINARVVPPGGMLSFLYSGYPTEGLAPGLPPQTPGDAKHLHATQHHMTNIHNKSPASDRTMMYPYNPVAEHYKRMTTSPHPYMPPVAPDPAPNQIVTLKRSVSAQNKDDDDYDA